MRFLKLATALLAASVLASPAAKADISVVYPDGNASFSWYIPSGLAFIHWDFTGDGDIFTLHSTGLADPLYASLSGVEEGLAYWLDYTGTSGSSLEFDVYVNIGGEWFYVAPFYL
jgi:hypothetical protein